MGSLDVLASIANLELAAMAKLVNMHEAKSNLSRLVEEAEAGEEIVLARAGKPVARLVAIRTLRRRKLGRWKGKVVMSKDFDAPLSAGDLDGWRGHR
jgi:prevent-host-death family protein